MSLQDISNYEIYIDTDLVPAGRTPELSNRFWNSNLDRYTFNDGWETAGTNVLPSNYLIRGTLPAGDVDIFRAVIQDWEERDYSARLDLGRESDEVSIFLYDSDLVSVDSWQKRGDSSWDFSLADSGLYYFQLESPQNQQTVNYDFSIHPPLESESNASSAGLDLKIDPGRVGGDSFDPVLTMVSDDHALIDMGPIRTNGGTLATFTSNQEDVEFTSPIGLYNFDAAEVINIRQTGDKYYVDFNGPVNRSNYQFAFDGLSSDWPNGTRDHLKFEVRFPAIDSSGQDFSNPGSSNNDSSSGFVLPNHEVLPSASLVAASSSIYEGENLELDISTDSAVTWTITGVSSSDLSSPLSGSLDAGITNLSIPILVDNIDEANEVLTFNIYTDGLQAPLASTSVTIQDEEIGYFVSSSSTSIFEGETVTFTVERTSSIGSSLVPYTLQGVDSADVLGGSLSGSVQLDSQGRGSLTISIARDTLTEGDELLSFVLENGVRSSVTVRDFVQTQSIESVSYENGSHLSEGFGNGVVVNYTSNNTAVRSITFDLLADGATEPEASLTVTTDASGNASGTLRLSNDTFPEPDQTYLIQLSGNPQVSRYVQFRDDDTGNAISGGSGSEVLTTSDDDDVVDAGIGDDFVIASRGNDFIDGGVGKDAVEYQGSTSSEISLRKDGDAVVVGLSGKSDRLLDVERLHFEDQWVALDMNGNAGNAAKMIVAAFGPDLLDDYLGIGIGVADDGLSMSGLANLVVNTGLMPFSTSSQFVDLVFNNLLDRDANALEKNLYSGYLDDGLYTEADLLVMAADTQMANASMLDFAIDNVGLPYLNTLV